jgi:hypothetical protein
VSREPDEFIRRRLQDRHTSLGTAVQRIYNWREPARHQSVRNPARADARTNIARVGLTTPGST